MKITLANLLELDLNFMDQFLKRGNSYKSKFLKICNVT
ncbi:hypothetical protein LEP1GSC172_2898 [Leptospira noguchii]|uniref:Uncharacterized protein n=1 Tax=Leptospira noguchii TaxID=28182 RepID=M6V655_9LEPT|nr:hypothetical protein LEP1GSC172_2898 [Leptospira noguchii]